MTEKQLPLLFRSKQEVIVTQKLMMDAGVLQNCSNCGHADHERNICKLYNATPPMKVCGQGCNSWEYDIPF